VTGYSDERIDAMDAIEFFPEADRPNARRAFGRAFDGERVQFEGTVEPIDGEAIRSNFAGRRCPTPTARSSASAASVATSRNGRPRSANSKPSPVS